MMADALVHATDTKACVVGPGAADGAAAMFRELFPSDAKAILIEDPRTKSVAGDNVASRLKGAGVEVSEYVVNPDGSDFHATYAKVEEVREAIRASGIDNLLIVAGEDPKVNSVAHFCDVARLLKPMFSNLSLEVAPQSEEGYRAMFEAGFESLTCFQETYDQEQYKYFHPAGPKSNYEWRLWTQLRAGKAGFRILGCAFLLGLTPWRREAASLAAHALYLMKECYESKVQFAFPRFCRVEGGFVPPCEVDERDVDLMMLAFRIVFPQCCMTVSTREAPKFRDYIVQVAADNMSAGSRVTPGGYAVLEKEHAADVAQFTLTDRRAPKEVYDAIRANGQEVVFKNWDNRI